MTSNQQALILRPQEDQYQEWAINALEIIRAKYGVFANYLMKEKIPRIRNVDRGNEASHIQKI
jgi:hypothetical protein